MNNTVMTNSFLQFKDPLSALDTQAKKVLYRRALLVAFAYIGLGIVCMIAIILLGEGLENSRRRSNGFDLLLCIGAICGPLYGLLQIITIKNRATDLARNKLVAQNPELQALNDAREADLAERKSTFLKRFTFGFAGTMILASIIFAIYATLYF